MRENFDIFLIVMHDSGWFYRLSDHFSGFICAYGVAGRLVVV